MTNAIKNAMAPFGKNFFSSGDSMLVVYVSHKCISGTAVRG